MATAPQEQERVDLLREELRQWRADHGLSWDKVAGMVGVPTGTLSPWAAGKYQGDNVRVADEVRAFLDTQRKTDELAARVLKDPGFLDTPSAARLMDVLAWGHTGEIVAIAAAPGVGKTMACREYQRRASNVWLATMSPATAGLQPMQARVLAAMGCDEQRTSPEALSARIKARMRGSRGLLIIDEAQELTERSLDEVRSWHDDTGVGIALVGDERVIARLGGQRARELARLHSRVSMRYPQARATAEDGATVARGWGLKDRAIVERLSQLAQRPGGLRGVVKTIKLASLVAGAGGVTLDEIDSAWRKLGYEAISGVAR